MKPYRLMRPIFCAAALVIAASIAIMYLAGAVVVQDERRMAEQLESLKRITTVGSILKDAETGQRGYLLTGEERYLEPYTNALGALKVELNRFQVFAEQNDLPKASADDVVRLTQQKLDELAKTVRLRKDKGLEAALVEVRSDRGMKIMDQIRSELADMQSQAQRNFDGANHRVAGLRHCERRFLAVLPSLIWRFCFGLTGESRRKPPHARLPHWRFSIRRTCWPPRSPALATG